MKPADPIPLRPAASAGAFERARRDAAEALRGGAPVVLLTLATGVPPGRLLRAVVDDAQGCRVGAGPFDLEGLASRILARLGAPAMNAPVGVIRAYVAHLRARGRRLVVGLERPWSLPVDTARELGALLRVLGGDLQLAIEEAADRPERRLCEALGVEPVRVAAEPEPRAAEPRSADVRPVATRPGAPRGAGGWPRPLRRRPLAVGAGLTAALVGIGLVATRPDEEIRAPRAGAARAGAAPELATLGPGHAPGRVAAVPSVPGRTRPRSSGILAGLAYEMREEGAASHEEQLVEDAERVGRRALTLLADARTEAAWEEGTRILREIGPQPALMDALEQLAARPGCVRKRRCASATRARLHAALCAAWADAVERGEAPGELRCS